MSLPALVFEIEIRSTPERIWEAITSPDLTRRYFHDTAIRSDWRAGSKVVWENPDGTNASEGEEVIGPTTSRGTRSCCAPIEPRLLTICVDVEAHAAVPASRNDYFSRRVPKPIFLARSERARA